MNTMAHESDDFGAWGQDGISEEDLAAVKVDVHDSSLPDNKIFVGNLPKGVRGADVARALRNCGDVAKVWFFDTEDQETEKGKSSSSNTFIAADKSEEMQQGNAGKEGHVDKAEPDTVLVHKGHEELVEHGVYLAKEGVEMQIHDIVIEDEEVVTR